MVPKLQKQSYNIIDIIKGYESREHDADSNLLLPMLSTLDKHLNIATEGLEA